MEINYDQIEAKVKDCIEGTVAKEGKWVLPFESCSVAAGFCETPDGRKAQIIITVQTDEDEWIDEA
jgi:hypothetical protein